MPSLRRHDRVRVIAPEYPHIDGRSGTVTVRVTHEDGDPYSMVKVDGTTFEGAFGDDDLEVLPLKMKVKAKRETGAARRRGERNRG